jgi:hypothetical protein
MQCNPTGIWHHFIDPLSVAESKCQGARILIGDWREEGVCEVSEIWIRPYENKLLSSACVYLTKTMVGNMITS